VRPRLAAAGLFLLALLVHVGLALPARREAAVAQDRFARLREEGQALAARVARLEHAAEVSARAAHMELPPGTGGDAVGRLRRSLLGALDGQTVSGVRLAVQAGNPPFAAEARLRAEGAYAELVRLSGRVVRPGAGLVLRHVRFKPSPEGTLVLEVEGGSVAAQASELDP
jgi:hypothetical protein